MNVFRPKRPKGWWGGASGTAAGFVPVSVRREEFAARTGNPAPLAPLRTQAARKAAEEDTWQS